MDRKKRIDKNHKNKIIINFHYPSSAAALRLKSSKSNTFFNNSLKFEVTVGNFEF